MTYGGSARLCSDCLCTVNTCKLESAQKASHATPASQNMSCATAKVAAAFSCLFQAPRNQKQKDTGCELQLLRLLTRCVLQLLCCDRHRKGYSNSWITLCTAVMCVWGEEGGGGHGYLSLVLHDFRGESGQGPIKLLRHYGLKGTTVLVLLPQQPHRLHRQTLAIDCLHNNHTLTAQTDATH